MKTIGTVNYGKTSEFQRAVFLNDASLAFEILNDILDEGWYPENSCDAWTDVAVFDDKYYVIFGEDSVMTQNAKIIYIEIEATKGMISEYEYFKKYED